MRIIEVTDQKGAIVNVVVAGNMLIKDEHDGGYIQSDKFCVFTKEKRATIVERIRLAMPL